MLLLTEAGKNQGKSALLKECLRSLITFDRCMHISGCLKNAGLFAMLVAAVNMQRAFRSRLSRCFSSDLTRPVGVGR
jgi:hypothetical protein